jgi:hypothetical protein
MNNKPACHSNRSIFRYLRSSLVLQTIGPGSNPSCRVPRVRSIETSCVGEESSSRKTLPQLATFRNTKRHYGKKMNYSCSLRTFFRFRLRASASFTRFFSPGFR